MALNRKPVLYSRGRRYPMCSKGGCAGRSFAVCTYPVTKRDTRLGFVIAKSTECGRHLCGSCARKQPTTRKITRFFCDEHHQLVNAAVRA